MSLKSICVLVFMFVLTASYSAPSLDPVPCQPNGELKLLADKSQLLMFGELHGTNEMVSYFADVVCALLANNKPIKVGIEHPLAELAALQQYIDSTGTENDIKTLLLNSYWASDHQDGRTSLAMFTLVERMRQLKLLGHDIRVFLFDDQTAVNREQAMAEHVLAALAKDPGVLHVLLTGNIHNQTALGTPWDDGYKPMGVYVVEGKALVASINLSHSGGNAWLCTPDCKVTELKAKDTTGKAQQLEATGKNSKHQYQIDVGVISTSYPAIKSYQR